VNKGKAGKGRSARRRTKSTLVAPAKTPLPAAGGDGSTKAAGQRLYDMPYSAAAPKLINPTIGLHHLVARAGHNAAYEIDVTLLDAPDYRLTRSGVLLAHRVLEGRGEWFLTAPDWYPLLPKDRIETMGDTDLPEEFAELIRPLRRRATLGPVAALRCERREFAMRDDAGVTLALLRDDKVTVRRGGLTTARYREVMMTPVGPGLTEQQDAWLDRAITQAGATSVPKFPRLVTRLGAPATGLTDFPAPRPFEADAPFEMFVSQLLGLRLRQIVEADLAIRGGNLVAAERLSTQADQLRMELKGLSFVLDTDWVEDLYDELDWITLDFDPRSSDPAEAAKAQEALVGRLHSERYLALLDRLVTATRGPKLGDTSILDTSKVLTDLLGSVVTRIRRVVDRLTPDSPPQVWEEAWRSVGQVQWVADISTHVMAAETERIQRRLAKSQQLLDQIHDLQLQAEEEMEAAAEMTVQQAFEAGRAYERRLEEVSRIKTAFLALWSKTARKLEV